MDDQRLKEMLSAWFDGELASEQKAEVEAYIERSEEARRIVAGFKALKQLSDQSVLNPQSEYWGKSAARIEGVIGDAGHEKNTPVKKSGWSEYGWKAVSLAASVVLLTYVGFHSDEILDQMREEPKSNLVIPEKAREDQSTQPVDQKSPAQERMEESEPIPTETETIPPVLAPKPIDETGRQRDVPVSLVEPGESDKNEKKQIEETAVTIDQIDQPVEQDDEGSQYKQKRVVSKTELRTSGEVSVNRMLKSPSVGLTALSHPPTPVADSIEADLDQIELPGDISEALEEAGERLTFYDSTRVEATEEEQMRYLWNHVILFKLTALKTTSSQIRTSYGLNESLSNGLRDKRGRSEKKEKGGDRKLALNRERRLIDAAFFVGSTTDKGGEYDQALKYLEYMAQENDDTLDKAYALKKWEELLDM